MFLFLILSCGVFVGADKLDRTYLPPPGSKFAGGSPDSILPPIELPKEPNFSATTLRPQTPGTLNPPGFFETRRPGFSAPGINPSEAPFGSRIGFGNKDQFESITSGVTDPSNQFNSNKQPAFVTSQSAGTSIQQSPFHKGFTVPTTTTSYAFTQTTTYSPIEEECSGTTCAYGQGGFIDTEIEPDISISHQSPDEFTNVPGSDRFPAQAINRPVSGGIKKPITHIDGQGRPIVTVPGHSIFNTQPPSNEITQEGIIRTTDEQGYPIHIAPGQIRPGVQVDQEGRPIISGTIIPGSIPQNRFDSKNKIQQFDQQGRPLNMEINQSFQNNIQHPIHKIDQHGRPIIQQDQLTQNIHDEQGRPIFHTPNQYIYSAADPVQQVDRHGRPNASGGVFPAINDEQITQIGDISTTNEQRRPVPITPGQKVYSESINQHGRPNAPSAQFPEYVGGDNMKNKIQNLDQQGRPLPTFNGIGQQESHGQDSVIYQAANNLPESATSSQVIQYPVDQHGLPIISGIPQGQVHSDIGFDDQTSIPGAVAQSNTISTPYPITSLSPTDYNTLKKGSPDFPTSLDFTNRQHTDSVRPQDNSEQNAVILNYKNIITPEGEFEYSYDTSNGIHADENGTAINGVKAQGAYSYIGDDGKNYSIVYTADENGFLPKGDHLPTPPPVPEAILRLIEKANEEDATGVVDDGLYDEEKYGYKNYQGIMDHMPHGLYSSKPIKTYNKEKNAQVDIKTKDFLKRPSKGRQPSSQNRRQKIEQRPSYDRQDLIDGDFPKSKGESSVISNIDLENEDIQDYEEQDLSTEIMDDQKLEGKQKPTSNITNKQKDFISHNAQRIPVRRPDNALLTYSKKRPTTSDDDNEEDSDTFDESNEHVSSGDEINEDYFEDKNIDKNKNKGATQRGYINKNGVKITENKHRYPSINKTSSISKTDHRLPSSEDVQSTKGISDGKHNYSKTKEQLPYTVNEKATKGPQYLPTKNIDDESYIQQDLDNEKLTSDSKEKYPQFSKDSTKKIMQRPLENQSPSNDINMRSPSYNTKINAETITEQRRPISKGDNDDNLKQKYDINDLKDDTNEKGEVIQPFRSTTRKPIVSVRPTTAYDNSIQASTRRPSLIIQNNQKESNGYQYIPPRNQLGQIGKHTPSNIFGDRYTTLGPFSTKDEVTDGAAYFDKDSAYTLGPETNRQYYEHNITSSESLPNVIKPGITDSAAINNYDKDIRKGSHGVSPTTRPTYEHSRDSLNQQVTGSTQRPYEGFQESSRPSIYYSSPSTPTPTTISGTSPNYGSPPVSTYLPQDQYISDNLGYPQKGLSKSVTGSESPSSFTSYPTDQTIANIGINRFSSTTPRPYYHETGFKDVLPGFTPPPDRRPTASTYYPNAPNVASPIYTSQTSDPLNKQEHYINTQYDTNANPEHQQSDVYGRPSPAPVFTENEPTAGIYSHADSSTYPSQSSGPSNIQDHSSIPQYGTTAIPNYTPHRQPSTVYPGRRPTAVTPYRNAPNAASPRHPSQTLRPSNNQYGTTSTPGFAPGLIDNSNQNFVNGQPSSVYPGRRPTTVTSYPNAPYAASPRHPSQNLRPSNIQYGTTPSPDFTPGLIDNSKQEFVNGQSTPVYPGRRPTAVTPYPNAPNAASPRHPSQTSRPSNIQYGTTPSPDFTLGSIDNSKQEFVNGQSTSGYPGRRPTAVTPYPNAPNAASPRHPSQTLRPSNIQYGTTPSPDFTPGSIDNSNQEFVNGQSTPVYPGRRPTAVTPYPNAPNAASPRHPSQTLRPSNIQHSRPDFTSGLIDNNKQQFVNKSYIPSSIPSTLAPEFNRIDQNNRPITDAYGRPISTQDKIKGEDFSGPKQQPSFDPESGYHY